MDTKSDKTASFLYVLLQEYAELEYAFDTIVFDSQAMCDIMINFWKKNSHGKCLKYICGNIFVPLVC